MAQELQQSQMDKQNLERHIQKETLQHKEVLYINYIYVMFYYSSLPDFIAE